MTNWTSVVGLIVMTILVVGCQDTTSISSTPKKDNYFPKFIPPTEEHREQHPYGGWSCPDNILGFQAVNIDTLLRVPVVSGRLPTKEETQNGHSLIYIDTSQVIAAASVDMNLPRLANYYSKYTRRNELVIVIQVVRVGHETIVGFRNINGGNGSCWIDEIDFLSNEESDAIGSTYFFQQSIEIQADVDVIWDIITHQSYSKELSENFSTKMERVVDLAHYGEIFLKDETQTTIATGVITALWENMYMQVDYDKSNNHYVEKFLLLPDGDGYKLHVVIGPFTTERNVFVKEWSDWLNHVKEISEAVKIPFSSITR